MDRSTSGTPHWKRKRPQYDSYGEQRGYENRFEDRQRALVMLRIQAHEADIAHGVEGKSRAQSLEVDALGRPGPRSALIALGTARASAGWNAEDNFFTLSGASSGSRPAVGRSEHVQVWVDRYDARLLLDSFTLLSLEESAGLQPPSPTLSTWSDFPEDSEETFFLTQEEFEDYDRRKRRRLLDEAYERRLKEREEEEAARNEQDDGEPTEEVMALIQRTATHLLSASNPAQLEMRILANHGADERFSFLRDGGRWHEAWLETKVKYAKEKEKEKEASATPNQGGLGGIAGYSSDSESDDDAEGSAPPEPPAPSEPPPPSPPPPTLDPPELSVPANNSTEAAKEERRARAREWMLNRRKEKA